MNQPLAFMPPCASVRFSSAMRRSVSISLVNPSPAHTGQAPYGLLNENSLGVSSSKLSSQSGQAYLVE